MFFIVYLFFSFSAKNAMSGLRSNLTYTEGKYEDIDEKWKKYKTKRILTGDAWNEVLTEEELDSLLEIWRKKR